MLNRTLISMAALLLVATTAAAQQPRSSTAQKPNPPAESPATPAKAPEPPPQPINIKIEFTITDQAGAGQPAKKVVSMIAADRQNNSIRSSANVRVSEPGTIQPGVTPGFSYREVRINIDARPNILKDGRISLSFGLEYLPKTGDGREESGLRPGMSSLNERMGGVILESGKPMIVSQAADPTSDRRITVEVTATILK